MKPKKYAPTNKNTPKIVEATGSRNSPWKIDARSDRPHQPWRPLNPLCVPKLTLGIGVHVISMTSH